MRSSRKVMVKEIPIEEPSFCDSMWACVLNDYVEEEEVLSVETDPSEREISHKARRREERKERREEREKKRERRRSRSKNIERRGETSHGGSRHRRRRGSSSHSRSTQSKRNDGSPHLEIRSFEGESDSGREMPPIPKKRNSVKTEEEEEVLIPSVPSRELRKSEDPEPSSHTERKIDDESSVQKEKIHKTKKDKKRPPKLSIGDDSPREDASMKKEEAPPVLFRPIKSRYNPTSPSSTSSPRIMSPVSSPRSPSYLRVDSAEFNTMEDYQKKVLEARTKRSGRKFERIQAIRVNKSLSKADP